MVVAAYWMWRDRLPATAAVDRIQRKRPVVRISPAFTDLLRRWEQALPACG